MEGKKKGLATKEEFKFLVAFVANKTGLKGIAKMLVTRALPSFLDSWDDKYGDKLPEPWQSHVEVMITKVYHALQDNVITDEEKQDMLNYCAVVLNSKIDLKGIDEAEELAVIQANIKVLAAYLRLALKKK